MKGKLQDYALVAEIIGAISIVASLLFVGVQIQQNTDVQKAGTYQNVIEQIALWRHQIVSDPELHELFISFTQGKLKDEYSDNEISKISMQVTNFFGIVESAYYSKKYGLMGDSEWGRLEYGVCVQFARFKDNFGADSYPSFMSKEFIDYLNLTC